MYHYTDLKAAIVGAVFSILGAGFIGFLTDAFMALILGAIGAFGGYLMNKLLKHIDKKLKKGNDESSKTL